MQAVRRLDAGITSAHKRSHAADPDRDAPPPPAARACLEQAGDCGGANAAAAIPGEPPSCNVIPISADNQLATVRAVRALAHLVMNIAGVDEMQPDRAGDTASPC